MLINNLFIRIKSILSKLKITALKILLIKKNKYNI